MLETMVAQTPLPGYLQCENCGLVAPIGGEVLRTRVYVGGHGYDWVTACASIDDCQARIEALRRQDARLLREWDRVTT